MYVAGPSGIEAPPPGVRVALSTSSLYPESTAAGFELAARLGYDGIELMVWGDPVSQDVDAVRRLSDHYRMPVLAVHTPCLLLTQRVWGTDPWAKLDRSREAAAAFGAEIVVVHPPFRWQRDYARDFVDGVRERAAAGPARIAVENMFPLRAGGREVVPYAPGWSPLEQDYDDVTLDLSHTATSGSDALEMAAQLGDRLAHVHLADGLGSSRDEHLVPGRGTQPCAELLETLAGAGWTGVVVVEVSTRRAPTRADREADLVESLAFARRHLAAGARPGRAGEPELEPAG